jgi:glycosyltransferase involved in cell wall biosynthesis
MILTIITPTLNCRSTIEDTINSVVLVENNFKGKVQHLIGDSGSNDGTFEFLREYCNSYSFVKLFDLKNLNIPTSLNYLLSISNGNYLLVLNGDDYILPSNFTMVLKSILRDNFKGVYCGAIQVGSQDSDYLGLRLVNFEGINNYMSVNHPGMIVHKSVFTNVGNFDVDRPNSYDYCWTWKAFKSNINFKLGNTSLAYMRLGGISQKKARLAAREIFLYKINANEKFNAYTNYIIFYFKLFVKKLLPLFILIPLIKFYRKIRKSIDRY